MARISKAAQQLFAEVVDICARSLWKRKLGPFSKLTHIVQVAHKMAGLVVRLCASSNAK